MKQTFLTLGAYLLTSATVIAAEPVTIAPETGADLTAALNAAKEGVTAPGDIVINLAENGQYTVSGSLEVPAGLVINGNGAVVDATSLTSAMVLMSATPAVEAGENGFYTVGNVEFKNVNVTNLSQQLFYANKTKYYIPSLVTDGCQIQIAGGNKTVYDCNGGGVVGTLDIKNSTLNSTPANTGALYSSQSGNKATEVNADMIQIFSITNSTLYNIANGKNVCTHRQANQKWIAYVVKNNVILDCGKEGQFVKGLNQGQSGTNPSYDVNTNSFLWTKDGVVTVTPDVEPVEGVILNSVGEPTSTFPQAAEGVFTLDASSAQAEAQVGAPKWLVDYVAPPTNVVVTPADGSDIAAAVAEAVAAVERPGVITINLAENGQYTLSASIQTANGLIINGANSTIDASGIETPFILMSTEPTAELIADYYRVQEICISDVTVSRLKNSVFYDNNTKYCVVDFRIVNSTLALATTAVENEALVSFKAGGAKDVNVTNSTVYGGGEVAKYFMRYNNSARLDRYGFDKEKESMNFVYVNNTFYKAIKADGQWANYSALNGQKFVHFHIVGNIWFDSSSDIIRRLSGGRVGSSDNVFDLNTYFNNGENVGDNNDKGTILTTNPGFKAPEEGDFTLGASTEQAYYKTGAQKWLVEFVAPDITEAKAALLEEIEKAKALLGDDTESEPGKALAAAIDKAQEVYDSAVFNEPVVAATEELKKAEADYTTSGINGVGADFDNVPVEYFNLQGVRVDNPSNGVYIRRQGDRVSKVIL